MLAMLALATLALATPADISVSFTSDSVYKQESIVSVKDVVEQEYGLYTIVLEQDHLLGYCIYDKDDTSYVDGLKFDDEFVIDYVIEDVDFSIEHSFLVKTVYTDDVAGMLAAAKDGDWSRILSNPLTILMLAYYILATVSIIVGGFGLLKSRKYKAKTMEEIAVIIDEKSEKASKLVEEKALDLLDTLVTPVFKELQSQNQAIIEALILSQSGDKDAKLALINLLKDTATKDVTTVSSTIAKSITDASILKEKAKKEADKLVKEISSGKFLEDKSDGIGGISI